MKVEVNILAVNGSPRRKNNTSILLADAIAGAAQVTGATIKCFEFGYKTVAPCRGSCAMYCLKHAACVQKDDFAEFVDLWMAADGVILATPVYHLGLPAQLKGCLDRLGEIFITSTILATQVAGSRFQGPYPRFLKVGGAIAQAGARYGGQEIAMQQILHHLVTMNCIPVKAEMPVSYLGVGGYAHIVGGFLEQDEEARKAAHDLGRRVAELAGIVKVGRGSLASELPEEYFPERLFQQRVEEAVR